MATFRWRGSTSNNWANGSNWVNEASVAYGDTRYPGSESGIQDEVVFDSALASGASAPTSSVNLTGGQALKKLLVSSSYTSSIGTSAASGYLIGRIVDVVIANSANVYLHGWATSGGIDNLNILDGNTVYIDGTIKNLIAQKGTIQVNSTATISDSLSISYLSNQGSDVNMTIASGASLPATVTANGGVISNYNAITTLNNNGSVWTQNAGNITTLNNYAGTFYWVFGNVITANAYGGTISANTGANARRLGVLTTYPGATVDLDNGQDNIQVTSGHTFNGGSINYAKGSSWSGYMTKTLNNPAGTTSSLFGIKADSYYTSALTVGTACPLGYYDHLLVICQTGDVMPASAPTYTLWEASGSAHTGETSCVGKQVLAGGQQTTKSLDIWGYELSTGNSSVRIKAQGLSGSELVDMAVAYVLEKYN